MKAKHIKGKYSWLKHLDFIIIDICALFLAYAIAYMIKFQNTDFLLYSSWRMVIVLACLLDLIVIVFTGSYSGVLHRYRGEELLKTTLQAIYNFVLCCILLYVLKLGSKYSRTVIILMYGLYFFISLVCRTIRKKMILANKVTAIGNCQKTIFVIGNRANIISALRSINSGFFNEYDVKGICIIDGELGEKVSSRIDLIDQRGHVQETYISYENQVAIDGVEEYILKNNIEEVFIGINPNEISKNTYSRLVANGIGIHLSIESMLGFKTDDQFITTVGTTKTLSVGVYSFTGKQLVYLMIKRLMDIFVGIIGMIVLLPLSLVIKISYLLAGDSKSIFYTQTRVGLNGQTFKLYKFRSMVSNADELLVEILQDSKKKKEWDEHQKLEDDPRITQIGSFLRKTSLDELPQLINVLKGEMSLVGPRPLVEGELEQHNGLKLYHQVKPGITGWWGCNGRSNTTYDERLELEYSYVKNCSLYLDALCVIKTAGKVLKREGAV